MRAYSGAVADWMKDFYAQTRALLNDSQNRIATDEMLAAFIHEALNRVPFLAASLFLLSRGAIDTSRELASWPTGLRASKKLDLEQLHYLATVFRDIFQKSLDDVSDEGRLNMAMAQIRAFMESA